MAKSRGYLRHKRKQRKAVRTSKQKSNLAHVARVVSDHGGAPPGPIQAALLIRKTSKPKRKNKDRKRSRPSHETTGTDAANESFARTSADHLQVEIETDTDRYPHDVLVKSNDMDDSSANGQGEGKLPQTEQASQIPSPKSSEYERSPADKVFGIYELCENVLRFLSCENIFYLRGINRSVHTTIATSNTLAVNMFWEPMPKSQQQYWIHSDRIFYPIGRERIAGHATFYEDNPRLVLPRRLHPLVAGPCAQPCGNGHLECECGSLIRGRPHANPDLHRYLEILNVRFPGPLPQLSAAGNRAGFVNVAFPHFVAGKRSFLDDTLLTQPPSTTVLIAYSMPKLNGSFVHREFMVENLKGVTIGDVRDEAWGAEYGLSALRGDNIGLMVLDRGACVVLPTAEEASKMDESGSLCCREKADEWNFYDMEVAVDKSMHEAANVLEDFWNDENDTQNSGQLLLTG